MLMCDFTLCQINDKNVWALLFQVNDTIRYAVRVAFSCAIRVDVALTCTTDPSIVADRVHPFKETIFPDGCGLFQWDNAP